jgi:probable HAF family extracellular repeat protein
MGALREAENDANSGMKNAAVLRSASMFVQVASPQPAFSLARGEGGLRRNQAQGDRSMSSSRFFKLAISGSLFILLTATIGASGGYKTVFLGELREAGSTMAHSVNDQGQVVGESGGIDGDSQAAFTWQEGRAIKALEPLPGGDYGRAFGVNDHGLIVGSSDSVSAVRAVLWLPDGKIQEIGTLEGDSSSQAYAVNNHGQVVGFSAGPKGTRAFIWTKEGGMKDLGGLPGSDYTEAMAINEAGQVVGRSGSAAAAHAVVWMSGEEIIDLGMFPGDRSSRALAINNLGHVAGSSHGPHGTHAFFWSKSGGMRNIGSLPGGNFSEALGMNDAGQVVGMAGDGMGYRGFLWTSDSGIRDLNEMLPANSEVYMVAAFAINERGQIAGYGGPSNVHVHHFNAPRAYLMDPFGVSASDGISRHDCATAVAKSSCGKMPGMNGMESNHQ